MVSIAPDESWPNGQLDAGQEDSTGFWSEDSPNPAIQRLMLVMLKRASKVTMLQRNLAMTIIQIQDHPTRRSQAGKQAPISSPD